LDRKSLLTSCMILLLVISTVALGFGSVESSPEKINQTVGSERRGSIDRSGEKERSHEDEIDFETHDRWTKKQEEKGVVYRGKNFLERDGLWSQKKVEHHLEQENYTKRDPIYIDGNDDFNEKAEENNWSGNGTEQSPYIIEGYEIRGVDTDVEENYAIIIRHTDLQFEVRNNLLYGASHPLPSFSTSAVALTNVANGTIRNNTIRHNSHGVNLMSSSYNEVINNTLIDNDVGSRVRSSTNNTLAGNNITIEDGSPMRNLAGIDLSASEDNHIIGNRISNYSNKGISASIGSKNNLIYHNIFIDNEVHAVDHGDNIWNKPYPIGGNYWDNHTGPDEYSGPDQDKPGSDGFVDEAKEIKGEGDNVDKYPLTTPTPPKVEEEDEDGIPIPGFATTLLLLAAVIAVAIYRKKKR